MQRPPDMSTPFSLPPVAVHERDLSNGEPRSVRGGHEVEQDVSGFAAAAVLTVLVADDDPDLVILIMRQLMQVGYDVIAATDGTAALQMARELLPDIAVLDVQMPNMTGIDVLERLRTDPATMHIPVILISAGFAEHTVRRGLDAGADDFLRKPLSSHQLAATVAKAFARAV